MTKFLSPMPSSGTSKPGFAITPIPHPDSRASKYTAGHSCGPKAYKSVACNVNREFPVLTMSSIKFYNPFIDINAIESTAVDEAAQEKGIPV